MDDLPEKIPEKTQRGQQALTAGSGEFAEAKQPKALVPGSGEFAEDTVLRCASLKANGVDDGLIVNILGLTEEEYAEIQNTEVYVLNYKIQYEEVVQRSVAISRGWDEIEAKATARVLQVVMAKACDPKYALMAAKVANTARRPMTSKTNTIAPGVGEVFQLVLPTSLTTTLKETPGSMVQVGAVLKVGEAEGQIPLKRSVVPSPEFVKRTLIGDDKTRPNSRDEQVAGDRDENIFEGIDFKDAENIVIPQDE